jgi:hypothetical protein
MPKPPSSTHRTPTAADNLRAAAGNGDLDPDATQVLGVVDITRPLSARDAKPGEHGHIDGPRGLQSFHAHDGGDRPHGHKRDSSLGRTAALDEYVPSLAATDPPGAVKAADPTPAGVPDALGASEPVPAPPSAGDGRDAAGSGRPLQVQETPAMVVDVPFDPTDRDGAPLDETPFETDQRRTARLRQEGGSTTLGPDDHVHLSQFEALRVCTALSEVVLRLQRPVLHAADKQACAEALLLIRDQLTVRADQAHLAAWGIQRDGAA